MEKLTVAHFLVCILLVLQFSSLATAQEVDDEREFNYDMGSEHGPLYWGGIHSDWAACGNGKMQSPIDLLHERVQVVPGLGPLRRAYKPAPAILKNRGHDMMLEWEGNAGFIEISGTRFELRQCHWHSPSEHTINGRRFAAELHMVHMSSSGQIAVVGIMYKIGRTEPFLLEMKDHLEVISGVEENSTAAGTVNPNLIKIGSRKYYRYMGSLTTPPCTPGVTWTIVNKVRTVTRKQLRLLRVAVHDDSNSNSRPTQVMNERPLEFYRPFDSRRN